MIMVRIWLWSKEIITRCCIVFSSMRTIWWFDFSQENREPPRKMLISFSTVTLHSMAQHPQQALHRCALNACVWGCCCVDKIFNLTCFLIFIYQFEPKFVFVAAYWKTVRISPASFISTRKCSATLNYATEIAWKKPVFFPWVPNAWVFLQGATHGCMDAVAVDECTKRRSKITPLNHLCSMPLLKLLFPSFLGARCAILNSVHFIVRFRPKCTQHEIIARFGKWVNLIWKRNSWGASYLPCAEIYRAVECTLVHRNEAKMPSQGRLNNMSNV